MMSLLLAASLGMGLDLGGFPSPSAERPVLRELSPVATLVEPSFVLVDRPELVDDGQPPSIRSGVLIVDRPEPATTHLEPPEPRIRYLHNGVEIDAQEFYRRLNQRR